MKRWLAAVAVFAACACHVDIAAADTRAPTLWQRIVSVFAPRPVIRHPAGQHTGDNAQKAVAAAKPTTEAPPASEASGTPPQLSEPRRELAALEPEADHTAAAAPVEMPSRAEPSAPAVQLQALLPVTPAKPTHKHERHDHAKKQPRVDTTAALPSSAPASPEQPVTAFAEPSEPPATVAPGAAAFKPSKKVKRDQAKAAPGYQLASLGSPGLKAALAPENAQPEGAPRSYEGAFPPAPTHGSVCNTGRKVITAYYWEGSRTASGQPFNPHAMTAAHRTLPFGTRLNVTNPRTGQSVEVVVNDRGPYVSGVGLDLSIGAAQAIGLHGTGSVCIL
jgi:peptidoglycan lytic transglycosylase